MAISQLLVDGFCFNMDHFEAYGPTVPPLSIELHFRPSVPGKSEPRNCILSTDVPLHVIILSDAPQLHSGEDLERTGDDALYDFMRFMIHFNFASWRYLCCFPLPWFHPLVCERDLRLRHHLLLLCGGLPRHRAALYST